MGTPSFPLPKEHGAWALLYGPFLAVVLAFGDLQIQTLLLFITLTAVFLAHEPLSRLARLDKSASASRRLYWTRWLIIYLLIAAVAGGLLVFCFELWLLIPFGGAVLLLLLAHVYLISNRLERSVAGELLGVVGLTSGAPASYYALQGRFDQPTLIAWVLVFLYFSSAIFYVKMRVSRFSASTKSSGSLKIRNCVLYHTLLLAVVLLLTWKGLVPQWTLVAFLPIVLRAFWGIRRGAGRLNLKRVGYTEVGHTVYFILVMAALLRFS
jgi:hypothetical protein